MSVVTVDAVNQALATVIDPNTGRDLFSSRSARNVRVDEGHVSLDVELGYPALSQINPIREAVQAAIQKIPGVQGVTPHVYQKIIAHSVQGGVKLLPQVRNIIAVASGKGGVGKSTMTANLALALAAEGATVGVLDADIYGPSQPVMFGIHGRPHTPDGQSMEPMENHGVQVSSIGFLIDMDQPMVWRGPLVVQALEQLLRSPESQAIVRDFGSASASASGVPGGNAVADSIIQRYGPDLAARLNQLHQARNAVRQQYLDAMNAMRQARQQLGKAIVNRINYDLREFNHACNTGDWRRAGQQFGLMVNALAQAADGAQGLTRGAQAAARGGARLARRGWRRWASRLEMATLRRTEPGGFRLGPWGTWAALALRHLARERPPHQAAQPIQPLAWNWG